MRFYDKRNIEFLLRNGEVATMRNYLYKVGQRILINRKYRARVIRVFNTSDDMIEALVNKTPYRDSDEWKKVAMELHRSKKLPKFIVLVKLESQR